MKPPAVSYLFVPASRPDRFTKALASDADAVIIDLEDAVAHSDKDSALEDLTTALDAGLPRPAHVRVNSADSPWFGRDIQALADLTTRARQSLAGIVVPKAETTTSLIEAGAVLEPGQELIATIESAAGLVNLAKLAAVDGVTRFALGAADLSVDLDIDATSATVDYVYSQLVVASRAAGLAGPVASPPFAIHDHVAIENDAHRLHGMGMAGQLCIHPGQVPSIHAGFAPDQEQVDWAHRVLQAMDGASQVDGQMVDKPVQQRATQILARVRPTADGPTQTTDRQ